MGFSCGIVGLPNVGKSTLFNALTDAQVSALNFPFCTVEPNVGTVAVPDKRLSCIAEIASVPRIVPTTMRFVDIAGLIHGASKGEGLGNKFLAHIREVDAVAHVVRCYDDENVVHVDGSVSPVRDVEVVNTEMLLADLERANRIQEKLRRLANSGDKSARHELATLDSIVLQMDDGIPVRAMNLLNVNVELLQSWQFLTSKPVMYVANIGEDGFSGSKHLDLLQELAKNEGAQCIAFCGAIEAELQGLEEHEQAEFLEEMGLRGSGLVRIVEAGYKLLGLHHFFTTNEDEVRAWTVPKGTFAVRAAGRIHTDMERGFIRAEVIAYEDYVAHDGEHGVKSAGKWRLEGRDYEIQDGDIVYFRFNV
ncbi:MAG: redox-regulated ATPase YchF [Gammaproteobacteria bacterium]|nr:redox-regulated ATPase YchF [Gammaproteobacteria bacterium]